MPNQTSAPETLDAATLEVPETRMRDAMATQGFVRQLINNDAQRYYKRARVNGLIDGRPPYRASKLREAGNASQCNINWGRARSYMESGGGTFYDLFAEAPSYLTVFTAEGTPEQRQQWSDIISAQADRVLRHSEVWDYEMQVSIDNMTLHGCGPLLFEGSNSVLPKAFLCGDLKAPEFTKSDTHYWDACMIQATYYPPELFEFIENDKGAAQSGWDVEFTKKVIANAVGIRNEAGIQYEWEFYQAEIKNNAYSYYDDSKIIRLAHVFWKEFDGQITHAIVERDSASGLECKYLYIHVGKYDSFANAIHPMYFDHGNGGYHHSVTGLGVKMYGPMEYENRLICNLADKAFSPKMIFRPGSSEATQRMQLARYGDYAVLPKGAESVQVPVQGLMADAIEFYEVVQGVNSETLSSYTANVGMADKSGNPVTKFEKQMQATQQAALSKTQINRYYKQLDMLYDEIFRRLCLSGSTDEMAKDFQKECDALGVPRDALTNIERVQATRVAGQGSGFLRKVSIDSIFQVASALPEDGRANLIRDKIAAEAGQHAVLRYFPQKQDNMASDQESDAMTEVAKMKTGVPSKPTSSQNPSIFATIFIQAANQSLQSVQKGGDIYEVLRFLTLCGPAIAAHIKRMEGDKTREGQIKAFKQQLQEIARQTDQLKKQAADESKQRQQQQQKQSATMNDQQLKAFKLKSDIALKAQKQQAQMQQREQKHRQDMALSDASTAHDLSLDRIKAFQE